MPRFISVEIHISDLKLDTSVCIGLLVYGLPIATQRHHLPDIRNVPHSRLTSFHKTPSSAAIY